MQTQIQSINPDNFQDSELALAVDLILHNNVVAFPTETVYGLGASVFSELGIQKIFDIKGRPADNPLICHIASLDMLEWLVEEIPSFIRPLCQTFWPGPLTILFRKKKTITPMVTARLSTIGIRMPANPIAHALIQLAKVPIAAPSANLSGRPSPTLANHVYKDLNGKISLILDGGPCLVGVESTVIDCFRNPPVILRPGGISLEKLRQFIPNIVVYEHLYKNPTLEQHPSTPGLKYTHYAPKSPTILIEGSPSFIEASLIRNVEETLRDNKIIGILHTRKDISLLSQWTNHPNIKIYNIYTYEIQESLKTNLSLQGTVDEISKIDSKYIAHELFKALRAIDEMGVDKIIVEGIPEEAEGLAVMNRLRKAAIEIITLTGCTKKGK